MKKVLMSLTLVTVASSILSGCVDFEPYVGKQLNAEARGIAMVRTTPYGCQVLGEAEGKDNIDQFTEGYNKAKLRESALNDLRNQAAEIVGNSNKRIALRIIDERILCNGKCNKAQPALNLIGYQVKGQIFECGDKVSSSKQN